MNSIHQLLDRYIDEIKARGYPIDRYLNPGLTRQQIIQQSIALSFAPPEEIFQLYEWHNGVDEACRVSLFRDNHFLRFDQPLKNMKLSALIMLTIESISV